MACQYGFRLGDTAHRASRCTPLQTLIPGMNDLVRLFLDANARGEMPPGGWLYPTAIKQSQLDGSDASVARLDHLIRTLRERARPSHETLFSTEAGRNFCALIVFYVLDLAQRRTGARIEWFRREQAPAVLADGRELPDEPFARLFARMPEQDAVFFPLGWLEECLMGRETAMSAADYLERTIERIQRANPVDWSHGVEAVGVLAAWQMIQRSDGGTVVPTLLSSNEPQRFVALAMPGLDDDLSAALMRGADRLEGNPDGARWQALSYDGWVVNGGLRQDAVVVALQTYGATPLHFKMAFPYRPGNAARRFAILTPEVQVTNASVEQVEQLQGALWRGIERLNWPRGESWAHHQAPAPGQARTPAEPAAAATPPGWPVHVPAQAVDGDLAPVLPEMQARLARWQQTLSASTLEAILGPRPDWMASSDALGEVFVQQRRLLAEGQVVWGGLVQANRQLFSAGSSDCPALVIHSTDLHFDERPRELALIAQRFLEFKGSTPTDPTLRAVAQRVTDEMDRSLGFSLPPVFSRRPLQSCALMVFRRHLPRGVLTSPILPLLTHPSTPAVMILPAPFWPPGFAGAWQEGRL